MDYTTQKIPLDVFACYARDLGFLCPEEILEAIHDHVENLGNAKGMYRERERIPR